MAVSGKYGQVNIQNIGPNEPVFILRAQDELAVYAIEMYKLLADSHGCSITKSIDKDLGNFKNWPGKKKMPD
jgi:hypothetical protein